MLLYILFVLGTLLKNLINLGGKGGKIEGKT